MTPAQRTLPALLMASALALAAALPSAAQAPGLSARAGHASSVSTHQQVSSREKVSQRRTRVLARLLGARSVDPYSRHGRAALDRHGFRLVSKPGRLRSKTTNNSFVDLPRPSVVYDLHTNRYFASGSYVWNSYEDNFDGSDVCVIVVECVKEIGGHDGVGLRFSKTVPNKTVSATFFGAPDPVIDHFGQFTSSNPEANSSSGVSYRVQDKIYTGAAFGRNGHRDFNIWRGVVSMEIGPLPCGKKIQLYTLYSHTWSSTSVNGFGVSVDGFSVSWTEADHHWQAASQSGTYQRC